MLRVEDIRNPARKSGFDHVGNSGNNKLWQANVYGGKASKAGHAWWGPTRALPEDAAQDYCDYINGNPSAARTPALKSAKHNGKRNPLRRDEEVEYALGVLRDARAQRAGKQGYVYLIGQKDWRGDTIVDGVRVDAFVKVGYSTNPEARVPELQTGNARELVLLAKKEGTLDTEAAIHKAFIDDNVLQEWFRLSSALLSEFGLDRSGFNTYYRKDA